MNKAQLQIQFNWIFVLIIGSVLLIFFFALINQQSKSTDDRISISQSKYFETVITATAQKVGTLKEYSIPNLEVRFECDTRTNSYGYTVENLPSRDAKYDIIFTKETLIGDNIQTWTQIWEVPFKAATFLYITNSNQGYIFYNHSAFSSVLSESTTQFKDLYGGFPKNISVELVDEEFSFHDVVGRNYESNTYIFLYGEEPRNVEFNEKADNKIIVLRRGEDSFSLFDYGDAYYFSDEEYNAFWNGFYTTPTEEELADKYATRTAYSSYLGKASLYGTIFSENSTVYECNMHKAFSRLQLVTRLYYLRTNDLIFPPNTVAEIAGCTNLANTIISTDCQKALGICDNVDAEALFPFQRLYYLSETVLEEGYSNQNTQEAYKYLFELDENNRFISRLANCPAIY